MQFTVMADPEDRLEIELRWAAGGHCQACTDRIPGIGAHATRLAALRARHRGMTLRRKEAAPRRFWFCLPCLDKMSYDELRPV